MVTPEQEKIAKKVLNCAYEVHSLPGAGLAGKYLSNMPAL
jgi:hypothetical protein